MGLSIGGVFVNGRVLLSNVSTVPVTFEGTNLTLAIPLTFAGSPSTFTSTNVTPIIPVTFVENDAVTFTNTANLNLNTTFGFDSIDVDVFTSTAQLDVPISFVGSGV